MDNIVTLVEAYSDGSATTANLPGGWAYVLCVNGTKISEGSGHLDFATNNVAELNAAIQALGAATAYISANNILNTKIVLVSDSQLTLRYANGEYVCRKPHLLPLYFELRKMYKQLNVETRWIKGHTGDINNERCDKLAKSARALSQTSTLDGL